LFNPQQVFVVYLVRRLTSQTMAPARATSATADAIHKPGTLVELAVSLSTFPGGSGAPVNTNDAQ